MPEKVLAVFPSERSGFVDIGWIEAPDVFPFVPVYGTTITVPTEGLRNFLTDNLSLDLDPSDNIIHKSDDSLFIRLRGSIDVPSEPQTLYVFAGKTKSGTYGVIQVPCEDRAVTLSLLGYLVSNV